MLYTLVSESLSHLFKRKVKRVVKQFTNPDGPFISVRLSMSQKANRMTNKVAIKATRCETYFHHHVVAMLPLIKVRETFKNKSYRLL